MSTPTQDKPETFEERYRRLSRYTATALATHLAASLRTLEAESTLVEKLLDTHQPGYGFLTPDQKAAIAIQAKTERRVQAERLSKGEPLGHGAIPAPGNVGAISIRDLGRRGLRTSVRMLADHLYREQGLCVVRALPSEPTRAQLVDHLVHLAGLVDDDTDTAALASVAAGIDEHVEQLRTFIDGQDQQRIGSACPHCGLNTLILFRREWTIRCVDEPTATTFAPCVCNDPLCGCKRNPIAHRHSWRQGAGGSSGKSWRALAGQLGVQKLAGTTDRTRTRTRKNPTPKEPTP